jgi:hypothetical protein
VIGESFIGQYRLSNRLRHSIMAVLSVLIVGALALFALSLRGPAPDDDSVRAGVSLPDPGPVTDEPLTATTEAGSVSRFDRSAVLPRSTTVTAEQAGRNPATTAGTTPPDPDPVPSTEPDPDPEPVPSTEPDPGPTSTSDPEPDPTPTTEPDPDPDPDPTATITIITLPDPTWITLPWPTLTVPLPTITLPTIPEPTVETTIPGTGDITLPTLPPESRPKRRPGP